jgi:hypothetical protein
VSRRPLLLIDVDGVLSLFGFDHAQRPPGRQVLIDGLPHLLSEDAAKHLLRAASAFEPAWCTGWEDRAPEHLPHLLGVPRTWPYVPLRTRTRTTAGSSVAGHWKLDAIGTYAGDDRPLAWIDDALDAECATWAAERAAPTLLVPTNPAVGVTAADADGLLAWAATLGPC